MAEITNPCEAVPPAPCTGNVEFPYVRYPCDYDYSNVGVDARGLPVIIDLQTPVRAEVVNRQREAILAIQKELGIQPSGTYSTVRERLDSLDATLCTLWQDVEEGASPVDVFWNGSEITGNVEQINFLGDVVVTDMGSNQVNVEIVGGGGDGYYPIHQALHVTAPGQTSFTLNHPAWDNLLVLHIEGIKQEMSDYVVNGNQLTWGGESLIPSDVIEVLYYRVVQGGAYIPIHQELDITSSGQTDFVLHTVPFNNTLIFWISGLQQEIADYSVNGTNVTWLGSYTLQTTDVVEVLYWEFIPNAGSGGGGGGGGSSNLRVYDEGGLVSTYVDQIDFRGPGVIAAKTIDGYVRVTIHDPIVDRYIQPFTATAGQTVFNLLTAPMNLESTDFFVDGLSQTPTTDYTVSGSTVTYNNDPPFFGGETVVIKYLTQIGGVSGNLGADIIVTSISNLPTPVGNVITLAANTVYGISGTVDIGINQIRFSNYSRLIGGGSSSNSQLTSSHADASVELNNVGAKITGLTIRNTGTGSAVSITGSANSWLIKDCILRADSNSSVIFAGPGLGEITDSQILISGVNNGVLANETFNSLVIKNTKIKGLATTGIGINIDGVATITAAQIFINNCTFEDVTTSINHTNAFNTTSLSIINCSAANITDFISALSGPIITGAVVINNSITNGSGVFSAGLSAGGTDIFRGNIFNGIIQSESALIP